MCVCRYGPTEHLLKFRDAEYTSTISSTKLGEDVRKNMGEVGMRSQTRLLDLARCLAAVLSFWCHLRGFWESCEEEENSPSPT